MGTVNAGETEENIQHSLLALSPILSPCGAVLGAAGADVNRALDGITPLFIARAIGNTEVASFLEDIGATA